jgi:hypothetical protein
MTRVDDRPDSNAIIGSVMKNLVPVFGLAVLIGCIPVYAHHSFATYYFEQQSITIKGEVVQFEYKNPHAWVHVMVTDETGQMQKFSAEWANPNRLQQQRITKDTIKPGDYVILTGSPGRNASEYKIHLKGIERPSDGWTWSMRNRRP